VSGNAASPNGDAARGAGVRASEARASGTEWDKGASCWVGPYRQGRYVPAHLSTYRPTPMIHIERVYAIRVSIR
jgi:hypothetical protein